MRTLVGRGIAIQERAATEAVSQQDGQVLMGWGDPYPRLGFSSLVLEVAEEVLSGPFGTSAAARTASR